MNETLANRLARVSWVGLVVWQFTWLGVLPAPLGKESLGLAIGLTAPLLLPLVGIVKGSKRALIWGGYLALFASMLGMMELWSSPPERPAAGLQLALSVGYLVFLAFATRRRKG